MRFADAGSSWCKLFTAGDEGVRIVPTREMSTLDLRFDWGTGHTARNRCENYENDLISLSAGAMSRIEADSFTALDLGSRDAKLVVVEGRRPVKLDWSVGCAAATGATLEMLGKFYEIDWSVVPATERWTPVTCGTYAVERIMDQVSAGEPVEEAMGRFIHGLARSSFDFTGRPDRIYLSGGFTKNAPYMAALSRYAEVIPMGRFLPLSGLWAMAREKDPDLGELPGSLAR